MRLCRRAPWRLSLQHRVPPFPLPEGHEPKKTLCKSALCFSFRLVLSLALLSPNHSHHNRNIHPCLHQRPYSLYLHRHAESLNLQALSLSFRQGCTRKAPGQRTEQSGYSRLRDAPTPRTPFLCTLGHSGFCLTQLFPGNHLTHWLFPSLYSCLHQQVGQDDGLRVICFPPGIFTRSQAGPRPLGVITRHHPPAPPRCPQLTRSCF